MNVELQIAKQNKNQNCQHLDRK